MARPRKKARTGTRRMETRNRKSSTQEDDTLVDTSEESEQEEESLTLTRRTATTVNENTLTQNTASAVEALFMIKQEEQHEFTHNSANRAGYQVLDDGTKVWGMTQEQREADQSTIGQEEEATKENTPPAVFTRKSPPVNPYAKPKARADPPASQTIALTPLASIATNQTTAIARTTTTNLATTASLPPEDESDDDSDDDDEDVAKNMSNSLVEDDCMLFSDEERKTLDTNRGKNTGAYEARKIATEHRFFEIIKTYG